MFLPIISHISVWVQRKKYTPHSHLPLPTLVNAPFALRSHAVLTVYVTMHSREGNDECPGIEEDEDEHRKQRAGATTSKLNLVDLAGSERAAAAAAAGEGGGADAAMVARGGATVLHREGRFINKSLTFLEQVRRVNVRDERGPAEPQHAVAEEAFLVASNANCPLAKEIQCARENMNVCGCFGRPLSL